MHISYDSDEESLENLELSEGSLPLCFISFEFIRDNFHAIINQHSLSFDLDNQEDNQKIYQTLPLCFSSFEKIRENYKQSDKRVVNTINDKTSLEIVEEIICDKESSLDLDLQPSNAIECQVADEGLEIDNKRRGVVLLSKKYLLPKCAPAHQHDGLHTDFNPLNQSISVLLEDNIAIYDEAASTDDHEEE